MKRPVYFIYTVDSEHGFHTARFRRRSYTGPNGVFSDLRVRPRSSIGSVASSDTDSNGVIRPRNERGINPMLLVGTSIILIPCFAVTSKVVAM